MATDKDELFAKLDVLGEKAVREKLAQKVYGIKKIPLIQEWLHQLESSRSDEILDRQEERDKEANTLAREDNAIANNALAEARSANSIAKEALRIARHERTMTIIAAIAAIVAAIAAIIDVFKQ